MPYNSNEGYIYVAYNGSTNQVEGVDIRDIMQATGCGVPDIGYIIQNGSINPMAKYKPVRHSQLENLPLTYAQRRAAKHGLSTEIPRINTGTPNVSAPWQYLRPQGGTASPYRYTDFAKDANPNIGYDARAVAPFAFGVEGASIDKGSEGNGGVGFPLYVNSGVNTWLSQHGSYGLWHEDRSLSIAEIMDGRSFENAYIGFSIVDMTDSNHPHVDIVSNKKFTEISSSVPTVWVASQSKYVNSVWCPKVRLFSDVARDGHTFRFIAFLHEGFSPPADGKTYSYYILRPDGSGDDVYSLAGNEYSLALSEGSDRYDVVVYRRDTIRNLGLTLNQSGLTMTNTGQTITYQGQTWRKYTLTGMVTGTITTPNNWTLDGIRVHVHFSSDYGFVSDTQEPPLPQYEKVTYISLPYANNTSTYNLLPAQLSTYVYIHSSVPANEAMAKIVAVARQPTDSTEEEITFDGIYIVRP
jgi:hypothetical protein